ncbi:MAG TPA: ABC transporter permease [Vicinamibacterales bacterium]|nr:ABC transporter permease [Vicinamibacterales bacterium]
MFHKMFRGVRALLGWRRLDRDIQRELDFHIAMESDKRAQAGVPPRDARQSALRDFGPVTRVREEVRDTRGMTFWDALVQDVRFGFRTLRRSPAYTLAAVLILALGIGANTAMFSVIDGVLLKPLPFRDGHELVLVQQAAPQTNRPVVSVSIPELFDYRTHLKAVRDLVEYHSMSFTLLNHGDPDRVDTGVVSANFFDVLGVKPLHGRTFIDTDDDLGSEAVLVLSHAYWQEKFGGDRSVVGKSVEMNDRIHTIVGVLPAYPQYPRENDVYMPTSACPFRARGEQTMHQNHGAFRGLQVFGRLVPGVSEAKATTEIATVAATFDKSFPKDYARLKEIKGNARVLQDALVVQARPMLYALAGATALVLLLACANVANLALARTVRRHRELALRSALGAGRWRLLRQLVTESVLVALMGGALGLGLAWLTVGMLSTFVERFTTRTGQIAIDGGVLAFMVVVSVLTGIVFGAAPALSARRNTAQSIRDGSSQAGESGVRQKLRAGLVVAQVAVSFVLLVGAALLLQSLYRLASVPLGYQLDRVVTADIGGNFSLFPTPEASLQLHRAVLDQLRATPGVVSAAATSRVPLTEGQPFRGQIRLDGPAAVSTAGPLEADPAVATDGYFETLGMSVLSGRTFDRTDTADSTKVAVINASMARYWRGADPVGSRFVFENPQPPVTLTVIGVVSDSHPYGPDRDAQPQFYQPMDQSQFGGGGLVISTNGPPAELVNTITAAVHRVNPQIPVEDVRTLEDLKQSRLAVPGLTAALLSIFAGVALLVTLAGITGVIATSVSQRTREFGLRMALGGTRASVLTLVMRQGLVLVISGLLLGAAGAVAFTRLLETYLFATTPTEPVAFVAVAVLFFVTALVAALGPARRATTINPLSALRSE